VLGGLMAINIARRSAGDSGARRTCLAEAPVKRGAKADKIS
jgi:hypothetical protein